MSTVIRRCGLVSVLALIGFSTISLPVYGFSDESDTIAKVVSDAPTVSEEKETKKGQEKPTLDIVFCVDCSGSMTHLMKTAQVAMASIARQAIAENPGVTVRFGLVRYGDANDRYFVQDLTEDHSLFLRSLADTAVDHCGVEFVGDVIERSLDSLDWGNHPSTQHRLYIIGNEGADQGPQYYRTAAQKARKSRVTLSMLYCPDTSRPEIPLATGVSGANGMARSWLAVDWASKVSWIEAANIGGGEFLQLVNTVPGGDNSIVAVRFRPNSLPSLFQYMNGPVFSAEIFEEQARYQTTVRNSGGRLQSRGLVQSGSNPAQFFLTHPEACAGIVTQ